MSDPPASDQVQQALALLRGTLDVLHWPRITALRLSATSIALWIQPPTEPTQPEAVSSDPLWASSGLVPRRPPRASR